jgi:hypothetical protein
MQKQTFTAWVLTMHMWEVGAFSLLEVKAIVFQSPFEKKCLIRWTENYSSCSFLQLVHSHPHYLLDSYSHFLWYLHHPPMSMPIPSFFGTLYRNSIRLFIHASPKPFEISWAPWDTIAWYSNHVKELRDWQNHCWAMVAKMLCVCISMWVCVTRVT